MLRRHDGAVVRQRQQHEQQQRHWRRDRHDDGRRGSVRHDPAPDPNAWQDTAMQNLVATRCAIGGCHDGTQRPNFEGITEAAMRANTLVAREVSSGSMPRGSRLTAAEKAIVANF